MDGKPYGAVVRLHAIAAEHWVWIDGEAAYQGVDPLSLTPLRFCSFMWHWAARRIDSEDLESWVVEMKKPLQGQSPTLAEVEDEAAAFAAFYSEMST